MNYDDVYYQRVTQWGRTYQERTKNQREELFRRYMAQSVYKVSFYDDEDEFIPVEAVFQPYKQDDTKTVWCLLVEPTHIYPTGRIFEINEQKWMILRPDADTTRGYLKYFMLKMTHTIEWVGRDGNSYSSPGYFYGPMLIHIKDLLESRAKEPVYLESNKTNHLIIPYTDKIQKECYFRVNGESYVMTGFDQDASLGVLYISANSTYERDLTPAPEQTEEDKEEDFFWLNGGK